MPVALRLMSQWRFNDVILTKKKKKQILHIFTEYMLIFKVLPKILGKCDFGGFFANYERK